MLISLKRNVHPLPLYYGGVMIKILKLSERMDSRKYTKCPKTDKPT